MEQLLLALLFKQMFKCRFTIYLFSNILLEKTKNLNNNWPIHCQGLSPTNLRLIETFYASCSQRRLNNLGALSENLSGNFFFIFQY